MRLINEDKPADYRNKTGQFVRFMDERKEKGNINQSI